ncbi:hypothetical protein PMN64_31985 [Bradyrhizobium sp. UFLA01-814]
MSNFNRDREELYEQKRSDLVRLAAKDRKACVAMFAADTLLKARDIRYWS